MQKITTQNIDLLIYLRGLFQLMKPRVMSLVIFTCVVGLLIAPNEVIVLNASLSLIAVALGAGAAGTLNMWYEADLDALMSRTCLRPIPSGNSYQKSGFIFWYCHFCYFSNCFICFFKPIISCHFNFYNSILRICLHYLA